ncbi:MAG: Ig-like domain-containing protein [Proteobacteria bacterium]|nr:Ig-like domain-containing protein [Pseudomonadota bacterium]
MTVTVTGTNDGPQLAGGVSRSLSVGEAETSVTTASSSDVDADDTRSYSVSGVDGSRFGVDGSGHLTFVLAPDYESPVDADGNNVYELTLTVTDSHGATSSQALTVTVTNVDEGLPTAVADEDTATEGGAAVVGNVLGNDAGSDTPLEVTGAVDGTGDALVIGGSFVTDAGGSLTLSSDGSYSYTPPAAGGVAAGGLTETFTVTVSDNNGDTSTSTLTIVVAGVNEAPVAVDDTLGHFAEDTSASIDVVGGAGADSDPDGDVLTVSQVDGQALVAGGAGVSVANGVVTLAGDGRTLSFTPDVNYSGAVSFTYTVSDGALTDTATVTGTVDPVNDPATVSSVGLTLVETDVPLSTGGTLTANDVDNTNDAFNANTVVGTIGTFEIDAGGLWSFTANSAFDELGAGDRVEETFTVTTIDGTTGTVRITINGSNDVPVITSDGGGAVASLTLDEGVSAVTTVTADDVDHAASALSFAIVGGDDADDFAIDDTTGALTFAAVPDFENPTDANGDNQYQVTVRVSDSDGGTDTQTLTVIVADVDEQGPQLADATVSLAENSPVGTGVHNVNDVNTGADTDPDGDALTYSITGGNASGAFTIDPASGAISVNDSNPLDLETTPSFVLTVTAQAGGRTDTATVTINLTDVDEHGPVVAGTFTGSVTEGDIGDTSTTTGTLTITDPDADDTPSFVDVGASPGDNGYGTFELTGGTWTYRLDQSAVQDLDAGDTVTDTITYTATDGTSQNLSVTIVGTNDEPVIADGVQALSVNEGETSVTVVTTSDVDADDSRTFSLSGPDADRFVINGAGQLAFASAPDFEAPADADTDNTYQVTVTVTDSQGATDSAAFDVSVTNLNEAPVAVDDFLATGQGVALTIDLSTLTANDSDPDGDSLAIGSVGQPANGVIIDQGNGTVLYTPASGFSGNDSFSYTLIDGNGGTDTGVVNITVTAPVNVAPVAGPDTYVTGEDSTLVVDAAGGVLGNDTDGNGDVLNVNTTPVVDVQHGSLILNIDGSFTYTPEPDYFGPDSFVYEVSDGAGGLAEATVSLEVTPANDGPTAEADAVTVLEDSIDNSIDVLANDTDPDSDVLTVTQVAAVHGSVSINADGTIVYSPDTDFVGQDTITYSIADGNDAVASSVVNVTVTPLNDVPEAVDDTLTVEEDSEGTVVMVLTNDTDVDGDELSLVSAAANHGEVTVNEDGTLTYTPDTGFNGDDEITYVIDDGNGETATAVVSVVVTPVADDPVAVDDALTVDEDSAGNVVNVLNNDRDPDSDDGAGLEVVNAAAVSGTVTVNPDGTLAYTPNPDFAGSDVITYSIVNQSGATDTALVNVTVTQVQDDPVAQDDVVTVVEDSERNLVIVLANDTDADGDPLMVIGANAVHGVATINGDGSLSYTPDAGYEGADLISYTISDGKGGTATAVVNITVTPVNDPPVANDDSVIVLEDSADNPIQVLGNDTDVEGDVLTITTAEANHGMVVIAEDGSLRYTPVGDFAGIDTITYEVDDGNGGKATAIVSVTVAPVNDAPLAFPDTVTVDEDSTDNVIDVLSNDADPDGDSLAVTAVVAGHGAVSLTESGALRYTPDPDYFGTDTITYTVDDGQGGTATSVVNVTVTPVNDPPIAVDDLVTVIEDSSDNSIDVLVNDSDADGDSLEVTAASVDHGVVAVGVDGLVYTPNPDYSGPDTITYTVTDGRGGLDTAQVSITVVPVNDGPVANDDAVNTIEDTAIVISDLALLSNDTDLDGDLLSIIDFTQPSQGTLVANPDNSFTYTPAENYKGGDSFTYTVSDGAATNTATVLINVADDGVDEIDLALTMAVSDATPTVGERVQISLVVTNTGPDLASGIAVRNVLPAGLALVNASAGQGGFDSATGVWTVGTLEEGGSTSLTLTVTANSAQSLTNTAEVVISQGVDVDSTPGNGLAGEDDLASVRITGQPVVVDPGSETTQPGQVTPPPVIPGPVTGGNSGGGSSVGGTGGSTSLTPTIPAGPSINNVLQESERSIPSLNPIVLSGEVPDQLISQGVLEMNVADGEFTHTGDGELTFEAFQAGGRPLPPGVEFDKSSGTFKFTADAAVQDSVQIVVVAREGNNSVETTFVVNFLRKGDSTAGEGLEDQESAEDLSEPNNDGESTEFTSSRANQSATETESSAVGQSDSTAVGTAEVDLDSRAVLENPVVLLANLEDQFVKKGVLRYSIADAFDHAESPDLLTFVVECDDPGWESFISFDEKKREFLIDADAAAELGITGEGVTVTVTASDGEGHSVSSSFEIRFDDLAEGEQAEEESSDEQAVRALIDALGDIPSREQYEAEFLDLLQSMTEADPADTNGQMGKESLNSQIKRAGEFGYLQEKIQLKNILKSIFG